MKEFKNIDSDQISSLGLGTWRIGGGTTPDYSRDEEEVETLRYGIDLGYTHIDTAEFYGDGHSEELVGKAIEPYDRRDLFITTKVWHTHLEYDQLLNSMKTSLSRLKVEYVDLYLVHWPNPDVPLGETMRALEKCVDEGYTRHIGVSNFSVKLMKEAEKQLKDHSLVANQVKYSLLDQSPRKELLEYCRFKDILLIGYSPLGKGELTRPGYEILDEMCEKYGKTPSQVALNWLISQENVITIPKASSKRHLEENRGALGWLLSEADHEKLSSRM